MNSVSEELNAWIRKYGNERDALNVALAQLHNCTSERDALRARIAELEAREAQHGQTPRHVILATGDDPDEPVAGTA